MNMAKNSSHDDLLTDCERSMRYHQARARFFNGAHLLIQFIVFALSSVGVYNLTITFSGEYILFWILAAVSLLALFSLVYNPAEKSALHKSLYRGFTMLAGTISATPDAQENDIAEWTKSIHALYAEEPPVYRALLAHCDNQVAIYLNADSGYFVNLSWYHRLLRNLVPFQGAEFPNQNQVHQ